MFIGHFAVGYALKKPCPKTSLGILIAAPLFLDLLWPFALLLGLETVTIAPGITAVTPFAFQFGWTHSLAMALVWSALFGGFFAWRRRDARLGAWLALGVFSHWVFDWISHRPDLPLYPGGTLLLGLGLWYSVPATLVVEFALYATGIWIYTTSTRALDRTGRYAWPAVAVFFGLAYLGSVFGPPPPSAHAIAVAGLFTWLFIPLFMWVDRHRQAT